MLDFELAEIYGYTTKSFNQQVKNNIEKFDDDFRFQLTKEESDYLILRSKNLTSRLNNQTWGGARYLPYAFTEEGIYMLMTVLKGDLATKQSKLLIRTFKKMKDYIVDNRMLINGEDFSRILIQSSEHEKRINKIENNMIAKRDLSKLIESFIEPSNYKEFLILNGKSVEADIAYNEIYHKAKKSIYIIDNYVSLKTLIYLKDIENIDIHIFSSNINKAIHDVEIEDFKKEYSNVSIHFEKMKDIIHDRYIILDYNTKNERIYLSGASSKDAGKKISTIIEIANTEKYYSIIDEIVDGLFVIK